MAVAETNIDLVHRRVLDSIAHVVRQQAIVDLLRAAGLSAKSAKMVLSDFKTLQHDAETCLSRLKSKLDEITMPNPPFPWKRRS